MSNGISAAQDRRPRRADARRNYDAIVQAARQAFVRDGVGTSIDDIARSAGVGNATLYRHFPTRDDLIVAALAENMAATHRRGLELAETDPPIAALHEWLHLTVEQISTYGGLPGSLLDSAAHAGSLLGATCTDMQQATQRLLLRAQRARQVREDITMEEIFDLAAGIAWVVSREGHDRRGARLLDLALTGLAPRPAAESA
ncbi:TetR/AcrR family transcriptional regulator [Phytohabitans suffuscus]|uniref:TetR family transcriptional regulator n=1 Tax=Phytohabitans suffuscus TaxID=624315 RepID=A0A6F8YAJ9_9ACTN|nr:TetR/AcrR family transcriptional regulator [Phytohabitans suffuscus]BCB83142.1 TetR family transcriptional regulator [Phytohabitans suffuscus]